MEVQDNTCFASTYLVYLTFYCCVPFLFSLEMLIPWTMLHFPRWFKWLVPLGITHSLQTYLGDEKSWQKRVNDTSYGQVNKHYIFFTDEAGTTWNGEPMPASMSQTLETFVGPAIMIFHIPFTIGK
jgi:hypothetical protein